MVTFAQDKPRRGSTDPTTEYNQNYGHATGVAIPKEHPEEQVVRAGMSELRRHRLQRTAGALLAMVGVTTAALAAPSMARAIHHRFNHEPAVIDLDKPHKVYPVQPGDTLYGIAQRAEPNHDPQRVYDEIRHTIMRRDNVSLQTATEVYPGELLPLPEDSQLGQEATEPK